MPKFDSTGNEIAYSVREGQWDEKEKRFEPGVPEGYRATSSLDGLTIRNIFIEDESPEPVNTSTPTQPPTISTPEKPTQTSVPIEPTVPAVTVEPTVPAVTIEPTITATTISTPEKPTQTSAPLEPTVPAVTVEPSKPATTTEPSKPVSTTEPTKPATTIEPSPTPSAVKPSEAADYLTRIEASLTLVGDFPREIAFGLYQKPENSSVWTRLEYSPVQTSHNVYSYTWETTDPNKFPLKTSDGVQIEYKLEVFVKLPDYYSRTIQSYQLISQTHTFDPEDSSILRYEAKGIQLLSYFYTWKRWFNDLSSNRQPLVHRLFKQIGDGPLEMMEGYYAELDGVFTQPIDCDPNPKLGCETNPWMASWRNLPYYTPEGVKITYETKEFVSLEALEEGPPEGYLLGETTCKEDEYTNYVTKTCVIKNIKLRNVETTLKWLDGPVDDYHATPMRLYRSSPNEARHPVDDITFTITPPSTPNGTYVYTWKDIPLSDPTGTAYVYEVEQGYWELDENGDPSQWVKSPPVGYLDFYAYAGMMVLNYQDIERMSLDATKIWDGGSTIQRPAVHFDLFRKTENTNFSFYLSVYFYGVATEAPCINSPICGYEVEPWKARFINLPVADPDGNPYTYEVRERLYYREANPDYRWYDYIKGSWDADTQSITNTFSSWQWPTLAGTKTWYGKKPESVTIGVYRKLRDVEGAPEEFVGAHTFEVLQESQVTEFTFFATIFPEGYGLVPTLKMDMMDHEGRRYDYFLKEGVLGEDGSFEVGIPGFEEAFQYCFHDYRMVYKLDPITEGEHNQPQYNPFDPWDYYNPVVECTLYIAELIDVNTEKVWIGGDPENRPVVQHQLFRSLDGGPEELMPGYVATLDGSIDDPCPENPAACEFEPWKAVWKNLPSRDIKRVGYAIVDKEITYTVKELAPPDGFELGDHGCAPGEHDVGEPKPINCWFENIATQVVARKRWVGGNPADHVPVTFRLYRKIEGGEAEALDDIVPTITPDPNEGTSEEFVYTWSPLPAQDSEGNIYIYYVEEGTWSSDEPPVWTPGSPDGYTGEGDGLVITNTFEILTTTHQASKVWDGGDPENRPAIQFQLYQKLDGEEEAPFLDPIPLDGEADDECTDLPCGYEDSPWHVIWKGLPTTDINASPYTYTVKEIMTLPSDYIIIPPGEGDDLGVITNRYVPPRAGKIIATKTWLGDPAESITFALYRRVEGSADDDFEFLDTQTISAPPWTYEWWNTAELPLPLYRQSDGAAYHYWVVEGHMVDDKFVPGLPGYDGIIRQDCTEPEPEEPTPLGAAPFLYCRFINTKLIELSSTKYWEPSDIIDIYTFPITFELYRTIDPDVDPVSADLSLTLNGVIDDVCEGFPCAYESAPWVASWMNLPQADEEGNLYIYSVVETTILPPGWGKDEDGMDVTNTYNNELVKPPLVSEKIWKPDGIIDIYTFPVTFELYRTIDPEVDPISTGVSVTLDGVVDTECAELPCAYEYEPWKAKWLGFEERDDSGNHYIYSVVETTILPPGWGKDEDGMDVTNTLLTPPLFSEKIWKPDGIVDVYTFPVTFELYRTIDPEVDSISTGVSVTLDGVVDPECTELPCAYEYEPWKAKWLGFEHRDDSGNLYIYSVVETTELPPGWGKDEDGMDVTNTYNNELVTPPLVSEKIWEPDGIVDVYTFPVTFELYRTIDPEIDPISTGVSVTLDGVTDPVCTELPCAYEYEPWKAKWLGFEERDDSGNLYIYSVVETTDLPPGWGKDEDGMDVTNTYNNDLDTPPLYSEKIWKPDGIVEIYTFPVTFELYRTIDPEVDPVSTGVSITLDGVVDPECTELPCAYEYEPWKAKWLGFEQRDDSGNLYIYSVVETTDLPPGWGKDEDGMDVTNTWLTPPLFSEKIWKPDGIVDVYTFPVTFELYRTIDPEVDPISTGVSVTLDGVVDPECTELPCAYEYEPWKAKWLGFEHRDDSGNLYTYSVVETTILPPGWGKDEDGMIVTNTYADGELGEVSATKTWEGGPSPRPTIHFQLWRTWTELGIEHKEPVPGAAILPLHDGTTTVTWKDIEMETEFGIRYTFFVLEVDAEGNSISPPYYHKEELGLTIKNIYEPPIMLDPLYMNKIWKGGKAPYPAIYVHLYRHIAGGSPASVGAPVKLDGIADQNCINYCELEPWKAVIRDLPITDKDGKVYIYTLRETDAAGNDYTPKNYEKQYSDLTVTNTFVSPLIDVTARKEWVGGSNTTRPTIRLQLYRNGVAYGSAVNLVHPATSYTWKNLPKHDENGNDYKYTVDELVIPKDYSKSVVGLTIRNTYIGGTKPPEVPYTGDTNHTLLYGMLALGSLLGFSAITLSKRRKRQ